ncbi:MAG: YqhA family protein [Chitinophagaceae bacterium]|nr:YqhA family protein [Chitinophagaceae bacterium]
MRRLAELAIIFRIISWFCFIGACFFLLGGIYKFVLGFIYLYKSIISHDWLNPGVYIIEGLDSFMVSMLFLIFSYGISKIFILHSSDDAKFPPWLSVNSFSELKLLLWETTIVTLIVFSISSLVHNEKSGWDQLIVPCIILLLSVAYFLTIRSKKH